VTEVLAVFSTQKSFKQKNELLWHFLFGALLHTSMEW
jgi:hypothetical protein